MHATQKAEDRRRASRKHTHRLSAIGRSGMPLAQYENAIVEDRGGGGVKIRSGMPLSPKQTVRLRMEADGSVVRAAVVWAHPEGLIEKRANRKLGGAFVAGCKILPKDAAKKKQKRDPGHSRMATIITWSIKIGVGLVALGVVAGVVYAVASLVGLVA